MITCSICGLENDDLAVLCASCKSYLQSKVDALNLFETIWQLIEAPRVAFKRIVLARHKNYVFVLSSLLGVSMAFAMAWVVHLGDSATNLFTIVSAGTLSGIPLGIVFILVSGKLLANGSRLLGAKASARDSRAVVSYASVPVVLSLVFVFPLEIAIFGTDFFGTNPPPMALKPEVYWGLMGFDTLAVLWSLILLHRGVMVLSGFGSMKSSVLTLMVALFATLILAIPVFV